MKVNICTINLNEEEGRQTIYWDTNDKFLHSTADDPEQENPEYRCETIEEAQETAHALWGWGGGWDLEWIEHSTWYAVMRDRDDDDWGTGSRDYDEAVRMAQALRDDGYSDAYIAVIDDGDDPVCTDEITDF